MVASLSSLTACDVIGGFLGKPDDGGNSGTEQPDVTPPVTDPVISAVSLVLNGGVSDPLTKYREGTKVTLPVPEREHYTFCGWYENDGFEGNNVSVISETSTGALTFYAKWAPEEYDLTYYVDGVKTEYALASYEYGNEYDLPLPQKAEHSFSGWYADSEYSGEIVTQIKDGDFGDKTFYGKFTSESELQLTAFGGYEEGAFVEFIAQSDEKDEDYKVEYKTKSGSDGSYKAIDGQLIRVSGGKVRADVLGLAAGDYTLRVTAGNKCIEKDVTVTAYDRSGYAHFGAGEGVGAYNADGTPKNGAYIVYVSEETKNSVVAPWNSKIKGLVPLLGDVRNAKKPVIVRILGTIGAATWSAKNWAELKVKYDAAEAAGGGKIKNDASIIGINGKALPTSSDSLTQAALISGGYNQLDTSVYTELNGLSSKISYKSSSSESGFDSCWNNCEIADASNVTLEGVGADAQIVQWGLTWKKCSSIEVRNITFDDYTEDACSFEGSTSSEFSGLTVDKFNSKRIWVHHNTFNEGINYWDVCAEQDKREGDGATDFKRCSYLTISYNHYYNNHKTGLIGSDDNVFTANVTFHHNFYDRCSSRLPLARQANMHMYNNYYYKSTGTNMSIRSGGYAYIEYCYFENAKNPVQTQLGTKSVEINGESVKLDGFVKLFGCKFVENELESKYRLDVNKYNITLATTRAQAVANDNIYYENFDTDSNGFYYKNGKSDVTELITDVERIPELIRKCAGVHKN